MTAVDQQSAGSDEGCLHDALRELNELVGNNKNDDYHSGNNIKTNQTRKISSKILTKSQPVSSKQVVEESSQDNMNHTASENNPLTSIIPEYTASLTLQPSSKTLKSGVGSEKYSINTSVKEQSRKDGAQLNSYAQAMVSSRNVISSESKMGDNGLKGWFGMQGVEMTDDLKADMNVIRMRKHLDPKRFYKSSDKFHNSVQVGTVIESSAEYFSSRLTKKERRNNLADEMMADERVVAFTKRKSKQIQASSERVVKYTKKRKSKR